MNYSTERNGWGIMDYCKNIFGGYVGLRFINLNDLTKGQEIPRIKYRPIKVLSDRVYFEKISEGRYQYWNDGIYRYDIDTDLLKRVDEGIQREYPLTFDVEVPASYEDVLAMQEMTEIYYCCKVDVGRTVLLSFFQIDTCTDTQTDILSYEYDAQRYDYEGMEVLCQGYFLFTLSARFGDEKGQEHDKVYLMDVAERACYQVMDVPFRIAGGKKAVIGKEKKYLFFEEVYLSEEEEVEFLMSDDVELLLKVPEGMDESFVYINRLNVIPFENFLRLVKIGAPQYEYRKLDEIYEEGILRTIGESTDAIYYKKAKHEHILRNSKEFSERRMIGKEEIFAVDKEDLSIRKIMDMEEDSILSFDMDGLYQIRETEESISVLQLDMEDIIAGQPNFIERFRYVKKMLPAAYSEYFYDIFGQRYLAVGSVTMEEEESYHVLRIVDLKGEEPEIFCTELYIVEDTVFWG